VQRSVKMIRRPLQLGHNCTKEEARSPARCCSTGAVGDSLRRWHSATRRLRSRGRDGESNEENNSFFASTGHSKRIRVVP
jgi:hypothetical protein